MHMSEIFEKTYSIKEAAKYCGMKEQTLRLWINPRKDKKGNLKEPKVIAEKIGKEYRIGESELKRIIAEKGSRQSSRDVELIENCKSELYILGTNALGPLHQGRDKIIDRLKVGVNVKILLLDPESSAFLKRENYEETTFERTRSGRLTAELNASLVICNDINLNNKADLAKFPEKKHGSIEVRFRSEPPVKSLIIIDPTLPENAKCNVNYYPEDPRKRGNQGTQYTITLAPPDTNEFVSHVNDFERLWKDKRTRQYDWEPKDVSSEEKSKYLKANLQEQFEHAQFLKSSGSKPQIKHEDLVHLSEEYPGEYDLLKDYIQCGLVDEVFEKGVDK